MKVLSDIVLEARERIRIPLTRKEFGELTQSMVDWDDARRDELLAKVPEEYQRALINYLEAYFDFSKVDNMEYRKKFYADMYSIPVQRLKKLLGIGGFGSVIDLGNGKVIKWYHKKFMKDPEMVSMIKFYKYCKDHPHPNFPVVHKVTDKYVVMEKLDLELARIRKYMIGVINEIQISNHVRKGAPLNIDDNTPEEVINWHIECCKYVNTALGRDAYPGDMRINNVGVRPKTKEIVWFDI